MKLSLCLISFFLSASIAVAQNSVPLITQPLIPDTHIASGIGFTLNVHGTGFVASSVVNWNGSPRATSFISAAKLQAAITPADVSMTGTAAVTVTSPTPGGGTSNVVYFPIHKSEATIALARRDHLLTPADAIGGMVTGDFNNDGKVDVVTSQGGNPEQIQVFFGNGDGTFQTPVTTPLSFAALGPMVTGDFNNDGNLDLIAEDGNGDAQVFLGNGAGIFTAQPIFNSAANSRWMTVGDLNGDGKLDFVSVGEDLGTTYASIFLGNGDGTFNFKGELILVNVGGNPAVGDFNRDGNLDLAIPDTDDNSNPKVDIFLGNGDGTFQPLVAYSASSGSGLAVGDVNADGKLDVITGGGGVLLGNGDGTFTNIGGIFIIDSTEFDPLLADLNNDGKLDLLITTSNDQGTTVKVLLGNGDGTFQIPLIWDSGAPIFLTETALGDFNNDGLIDVVDTNYDSLTNAAQFSVFLQNTLNITPTLMNFGVVRVSVTSAPQTATLTNTGTAPIPITSISLTGTNPSNFAISTTCGSSLAAGANCTVSVTFTPNRRATRTASVKVVYSGVGSQQFIELTGIGN